MEVRIIKGFVNALSMFILGAAFMGRWYCIELDITSGQMFIDWYSVIVVSFGLAAIHAVMWFDPSFKEVEQPKKRVIRVVKVGKQP
jgi:hypothetical protein